MARSLGALGEKGKGGNFHSIEWNPGNGGGLDLPPSDVLRNLGIKPPGGKTIYGSHGND